MGMGARDRRQVALSKSLFGSILGVRHGESALSGTPGEEALGSIHTYPRWRAFTCRLMPTIERRTLPQFGHRHLYITFTEF